MVRWTQIPAQRLEWSEQVPTVAGRYVVEDPDEEMETSVWTLEPEQEEDDRWVCYYAHETVRRGRWAPGTRFFPLPSSNK